LGNRSFAPELTKQFSLKLKFRKKRESPLNFHFVFNTAGNILLPPASEIQPNMMAKPQFFFLRNENDEFYFAGSLKTENVTSTRIKEESCAAQTTIR